MYVYVQSFARPGGLKSVYLNNMLEHFIHKAGFAVDQEINSEFIGDLSSGEKRSPALKWRETFIEKLDDSLFRYAHAMPGYETKDKVAILFTGGMDSTALALQALRAGKTVVPVVTQMNFDSYKYNFLTFVAWAMLRNEFGGLVEDPVQTIKVGCDVTRKVCFEGFFQQPTNAYSLAYLPTALLKSVSEIQMGLVQGDQSIPYMEDMKQIYKSTIRLSKGIGMEECLREFNDIPPLTFPLCDTPKSEVLKILKSGPKDHSWYTFSCEDPTVGIMTIEGGPTVIGILECAWCHSCDRLKKDGQSRKLMIIQLLNKGDKPIPVKTNELRRIGSGFFEC